jgi:hypothetical protein
VDGCHDDIALPRVPSDLPGRQLEAASRKVLQAVDTR